jgi:hypothetical protein
MANQKTDTSEELTHIVNERTEKGHFRIGNVPAPQHFKLPEGYNGTSCYIEYTLSHDTNNSPVDPLGLLDWQNSTAELSITDHLRFQSKKQRVVVAGIETHHFKDGEYLYSGFWGIRVPKSMTLPDGMSFLEPNEYFKKLDKKILLFEKLRSEEGVSDQERSLLWGETFSTPSSEAGNRRHEFLYQPSIIVRIQDFKIPKEVSDVIHSKKYNRLLDSLIGNYL